MRTLLTFAALVFVFSVLSPCQVDAGSLLEEMVSLEALARLPDPPYRTIQFSSFDRRSRSPEEPHWFGNSDGFGREPVPGFERVLRGPGGDGVGLYVVADVQGPGAMVRTWSAGMEGVLRVFLDGRPEPLFEGRADDFLCRKSRHFLTRAGLRSDPGDFFIQEDADYLPIPFASGLRITYEGDLRRLHFYHVQVRLYAPGTTVTTFDPDHVPAGPSEKTLEGALARLAFLPPGWAPGPVAGPEAGDGVTRFEETIAPRGTWTRTLQEGTSGALRELRLRLRCGHLEAALRGTLLRIRCDSASRPQVEAPVGDFFGAAPGIHPFQSLPAGVAPDGTLSCQWVMPFRERLQISLRNTTREAVTVTGVARIRPWRWDERSLYFRAKWRVDHHLDTSGPRDLPFLMVRGRGRLVGAASLLMNPSPLPFQGGNWWGEGDEKIFVDDDRRPSTFGTGSEDYYNYSWSRPRLFSHAYCGQPVCTGPGCSGYVSNFRWQVPDSVPFERFLAFFMEYRHHNPPPDLSYARIAYHYARPGAVDDHRPVQDGELVVPSLPRREPVAGGAARGARILLLEDLEPPPVATGGRLTGRTPFRFATRGQVVGWRAEAGETLTLALPITQDGARQVNLVVAHVPGGARVSFTLAGRDLELEGGERIVSLKTEHASLVQNLRFKPLFLEKGTHPLIVHCVEAGFVGLDYLWIK